MLGPINNYDQSGGSIMVIKAVKFRKDGIYLIKAKGHTNGNSSDLKAMCFLRNS